MALGLLWFARLPADSTPWKAAIDDPATPRPAGLDAHRRPARTSLLFGLGISLVVAPLTSTLMGSIPGRFSGLGSAINNSIARVGQPLLGALIFIAISATYYASLGSAAGPRHDATRRSARRSSRSTRPPPAPPPTRSPPSNQASIDAFHLAMLVCAGLLAIGALVSWYGLREASRPRQRHGRRACGARGLTATR